MNTLVHFEARRSAGDILAQKLVEQFERLKIPYISTGYEYFNNNTDLTRIAFSLLKKNKDGNSSYLRFFPDFTTVGNTKSLFVECKNSTGIEKDCYYNYKNMQEFNNTNIVLYLKNEKFCFLPDLKFKEANEWNYRTQMRIPITDKVWVEPRKMPKKEYDLYLERMQYKTSGCSYALIDFDKTKTFDIEYLKEYLHE
jgi:hypothetical protein